MDRRARLRSARTWITTYRGTDIVRGYSRWCGTDRVCAIHELRSLGVCIPEERLVEARRLARQGVRARPKPASNTSDCLDILDLVGDDPIALWQLEEYEALDRYYNPAGMDDQQASRAIMWDEEATGVLAEGGGQLGTVAQVQAPHRAAAIVP
jgi:hypothetical protein